jgi:hypothetical protein
MGIMFKQKQSDNEPLSPVQAKQQQDRKDFDVVSEIFQLDDDIDNWFAQNTHPDARVLKKLLDMRDHILSQRHEHEP